MENKLKYTDETDKSLGIAGMAISLVACDSEHLLAAVSLKDEEETLQMAEEFFFSGNPRISAKIAWNELLRQYQITSGLLLGNVMCRALSAGHGIDKDVLDFVHKLIIGDGQKYCSLDNDEAEAMYNKEYSYYYRMFSHPSVAEIARDFASTLRLQRRMTAGEVVENLRRLSSI